MTFFRKLRIVYNIMRSDFTAGVICKKGRVAEFIDGGNNNVDTIKCTIGLSSIAGLIYLEMSDFIIEQGMARELNEFKDGWKADLIRTLEGKEPVLDWLNKENEK